VAVCTAGSPGGRIADALSEVFAPAGEPAPAFGKKKINQRKSENQQRSKT